MASCFPFDMEVAFLKALVALSFNVTSAIKLSPSDLSLTAVNDWLVNTGESTRQTGLSLYVSSWLLRLFEPACEGVHNQ